MFLILTQDLMMTSSASSVARTTGTAFKSVTSIESALKVMTEGTVALWLIDLQLPGLEMDAIDQALSDLSALNPAQRPHCVGYAPHVLVDLIESASRSAIDEVLTRGQLSRGMVDLFARFVA